jgi:hypothetical protein
LRFDGCIASHARGAARPERHAWTLPKQSGSTRPCSG